MATLKSASKIASRPQIKAVKQPIPRQVILPKKAKPVKAPARPLIAPPLPSLPMQPRATTSVGGVPQSNMQNILSRLQQLQNNPNNINQGTNVSPAQPAPAMADFNSYGFDRGLVDYLNNQRQMSYLDGGVSYNYDPATRTFTGGAMGGPVTMTLAQMQAQAQNYRNRPVYNPRGNPNLTVGESSIGTFAYPAGGGVSAYPAGGGFSETPQFNRAIPQEMIDANAREAALTALQPPTNYGSAENMREMMKSRLGGGDYNTPNSGGVGSYSPGPTWSNAPPPTNGGMPLVQGGGNYGGFGQPLVPFQTNQPVMQNPQQFTNQSFNQPFNPQQLPQQLGMQPLQFNPNMNYNPQNLGGVSQPDYNQTGFVPMGGNNPQNTSYGSFGAIQQPMGGFGNIGSLLGMG